MTFDRALLDEIKRRLPLDQVVGRRVELKPEAGQLVGKCPFHEDDTPSFFVSPEKDGGVYLCRGCGAKGDLFEWLQKNEGLSFPKAVAAAAKEAGVELEEKPTERRIVATYTYRDEAGEVLYTIERWEPGKAGRSKDFTQGYLDEQGNRVSKRHPRQVLYRLPEVLKAADADEPIFIVEGEKCAEALAGIGLCSTTHAGGASAIKTWTKDFAEPLGGARVVLIPDNDGPGRKLADHVIETLLSLVAELRVLELPVKEKGHDVVEWLEQGGSKEKLLHLAAVAAPRSSEDNEWRRRLLMGNGGVPKGSLGNVMLVLEHAKGMRGVMGFDEHAQQAQVMRSPPWHSKGPYPRQLTDDDATRATQWLEDDYRMSAGHDVVGRCLMTVAGDHRFDPLVGFLRGLKWDGEKRVDKWLTEYFGADDTPLVQALGRCWLISAVARAMRPGCQVDHVLVLEGAQGMKKSSALRALSEPWFTDELPEMGSKDASMLIGGSWIIELAELDALKKSEVTRVKAFVTRRVDKYRPPYGRHLVEVPRRCVFAASTNDDTYLRDPTGNRRFWPIRCRTARVDQLRKVREQLWAEAVAAFDAGERWWLEERSLLDQVAEEQAQRLEVDPWEALSIRLRGRPYVTTQDVFDAVGLEKAKRSKSDEMRAAQVIRRIGYTRRRLERVGTAREYRFYDPSPPPDDGPGGDKVVTAETQAPPALSPPSPPSSLFPLAGPDVSALAQRSTPDVIYQRGSDSDDGGDKAGQERVSGVITLSPPREGGDSPEGLLDDLDDWGDPV